MLRLFFEVGEKFDFQGINFVEASNKLDSHKYTLERVVEPVDKYVSQHYFQHNHEKLVIYYTCWKEKETIIQVTSPKVYKKKGISSINAILSKKQKGQIATSKGAIMGSPMISNVCPQAASSSLSKEVEVLYIQLQPFRLYPPKLNFQESLVYMSIVYLLAEKIYNDLGEEAWPKMIPMTTDDGTLKFLKRGKSLNQQLFNLFKHTFSTEEALEKLPEDLRELAMKAEMNGDKSLVAEAFKNRMDAIINGQYPLKVHRGHQVTVQRCRLTQERELLLTQSEISIPISEFSIQFDYSHEENRQITLTHAFLMPIIFVGNRNNFLIKYMKQFKSN